MKAMRLLGAGAAVAGAGSWPTAPGRPSPGPATATPARNATRTMSSWTGSSRIPRLTSTTRSRSARPRPSPWRSPRVWTCRPRRSSRASSGCGPFRPCSAVSRSAAKALGDCWRRPWRLASASWPRSPTGKSWSAPTPSPGTSRSPSTPAAGAVRGLRRAGVRQDPLHPRRRAARPRPVQLRHPHPGGQHRSGIPKAVPALLGADVGRDHPHPLPEPSYGQAGSRATGATPGWRTAADRPGGRGIDNGDVTGSTARASMTR